MHVQSQSNSELRVPIAETVQAKLPEGLSVRQRYDGPHWQFAYTFKTVKRRLGLGSIDEVSQAEAEAKRQQALADLAHGKDPMDQLSHKPKKLKQVTKQTQEQIMPTGKKETHKSPTNNPIQAIIRAIVIEEIQNHQPELPDIAALVHQEVIRLFGGTPSPTARTNGAVPGIPLRSERRASVGGKKKKLTRDRSNGFTFGPDTIVRVNNTSRGPSNPRGLGNTQMIVAWKAIKEHLGVDSMNRTKLAREIETLLGWEKPTASNIISRLLREKCLLVTDEETRK